MQVEVKVEVEMAVEDDGEEEEDEAGLAMLGGPTSPSSTLVSLGCSANCVPFCPP